MTEFRVLVDAASDAALAIGGNSRVVAWNRQATGLLGYAPDEVFGRPCYDILQALFPNGDPLCTPACQGRLCFDRHVPFAVHDCSIRRKDGRWLRVSISSLVPPSRPESAAKSPTVAIILLQRKDESDAAAPADKRLRVSTFGRFALSVAGRSVRVDRWYRKQALTLLKLLVVCRGEAIHRGRVIECLWPDADEHRGRERLKVTAYFLRRQLRAAGMSEDVIAVADSSYALRREAVLLDCEIFEDFFNEGRSLRQRGRVKESLLCFEKAQRIYRDDFLPGERYADWCAEERERLREIYFDVLGNMVDGYLEVGDCERAAQTCRYALSREACRESFHRSLMVCLARLGQRDRAIAHYRRCRQVLNAELGVEPTPETERVYRALLSAS